MRRAVRRVFGGGDRLVAIALIIGVTSGCAIRLISNYDEQIDKGATDLQKEVDSFLTDLETKAGTPEASYDVAKPFYPRYLVDLRALRVRAHAQPKNELTEKQLDLMMDSVEQLRRQHQAGPLVKAVIDVNRDLFSQAWGAIVKLELAKKRGER
jgi:hypothetical protein